MNSTITLSIAAIMASTLFCAHTLAQEPENRKEFKRIDLLGSSNMEVISSISEYKPGEVLGRHFHHGVESGYFIQGGTIQALGEEPITIPSGTPIMNERDVHHAGFKVVGDKSLKIYTVHIVDKEKPLYDWVER
jgi:quercetin dioxygenase-like cupin family protein